MRSKWIDVISKYAEYDFSHYFTICKHHFKKDDFMKENNQTFLKPDAVPSIFDLDSSNDFEFNPAQDVVDINKVDTSVRNNAENELESVCKQCVDLYIEKLKSSEEIQRLKKKVLALNTLVSKQRKENKKLQNQIAGKKSEIQVR